MAALFPFPPPEPPPIPITSTPLIPRTKSNFLAVNAFHTTLVSLVLMVFVNAASEVTSDHYHLHSEGNASETEEMIKVLEAAWPQFAKFFQGAPKLRQEKLAIYFFNTRESWIRKLTQDGHEVPNDGVGGKYFYSNKTVYLYRQPTRYYTRCLLLHEAAHQFHYLTRRRRIDKEISASWYIEGVAEHLSLHHWDGQTLQLGAVPVSLENYLGKALNTMTTTPRPLVAMIQNGQANRPLGAMVIRYLATKEPKKFSRFAKAIEKGNASDRLFQRSFGSFPAFSKPFLTWLESHQEPLEIRFDEWERTGSKSMLGHSKDRISITTFEDTVSLVQCRIPNRQEETGRVGLVLSYRAQDDFTVALIDQKGQLEILTREPNNWNRVERKALAALAGSDIRLAAKRDDTGVSLLINDERLGPYLLPNGSLGLALDSCEVRFTDLSGKKLGRG